MKSAQAVCDNFRRSAVQKADYGLLCLLRLHSQRQSRRSTYKTDELASSHCRPQGSGQGIASD
jgi:hypothetical protein